MASMQIHQLQASYQADHDRILLRLNTHNNEEMRVWLTRRMLKGMLVHVQRLAHHLHSQRTATANGEDTTNVATFDNDFDTPFDDQSDTTLPLGEAPLLTTALHVTPETENNLKVRFDEIMDGSTEPRRSMEIKLGPELLAGFVQVLAAVLKVADWGLTLESPLPPAHVQESTTNPLDAFTNATRPKYLN